LTLSFAVGIVQASSSCIAFDVRWNLLAFGFNGKDYNAGTKDTWGSGAATDITKSGRPPFDGSTTNCYLSQFSNAIYVLGADKSNPSSIYIFNAEDNTWTAQSVTAQGFDPTSFAAVLDHDTNVFYAYSKGEIYSLDMALLKAAQSNAIPWNDVQKPSWSTDSYQPVMALAQNHVHFLNIPNVPAGNAVIFVIHYSYMQPESQHYGDFPAQHGQVTSFFKDTGVQQEFAFIPDDGSATYVINVESNTTQTLAGPITKDPSATYFASTDSLVQLTSAGDVNYLPYNAGTSSANSGASWSKVAKLPSAAPSSSGGSASTSRSSSATGTSKGASATGTGTTQKGSNGATSLSSVAGWRIGFAVLGGLLAGLL